MSFAPSIIKVAADEDELVATGRVTPWLFGLPIEEPTCGPLRDRPLIGRLLGDPMRLEEYRTLVERFIESLDEKKRPVFTLAEVEGMSAPEISACLEIKLNTVYSRIRLARKQFARFIEEENRHGS